MSFISGLLGAQNNYQQPGEIGGLTQALPGMQQGNQAFVDYLRQQSQAGGAAQNGLMANKGPDYTQANQIFGQTQGIANQLQDVAAGRGPNPALLQLQQTTDQNIARTRGQIGADRSLNPAMAARLGSMAGSNLNQQANQQGALLAAQQQLGAMGAAGNLLGNQANLSAGMAQQGNAQQLAALQAAGALGLGGQQLASQAGLGLQSADLNGIMAQQGVNAGVQGQNANINAGLAGGIIGGIGKLAGMQGMSQQQAYGGEIKMAGGGDPYGMMVSLSEGMGGGGASAAGKSLGKGFEAVVPDMNPGGSALTGGAPNSPMPSSGPDQGNPFAAPWPGASPLLQGGAGGGGAGLMGLAPLALAARGGQAFAGPVQGQAQMAGDNYRNDTIDAKLSPGEIVLPRSVTMAEHPAEAAADFVAMIKSQKGYAEGGEAEPEGYAKVLSMHQKMSRRLETLEKALAGGKRGGKLVYFAGGKVK